MKTKSDAAEAAKDDGAVRPEILNVAEAAKNDAAEKPEILKVRVLKNGLQTKAGTAARGLVMPMTRADAEMHAQGGGVSILGAWG